MPLVITTNYHWRQFSDRSDVPADVLASQFDWTDRDYQEHGSYSDGFICYRGHWYHLGDFMRWTCPADDHESYWYGYAADSFSSGTFIKLSDDGEQYQIASYYHVSEVA